MTDRLAISEIWIYLSGDPLFALVLTLATYHIGYTLYVKFNRNPLLNPAAISIVLISIVITQFGFGNSPQDAYQKYFEGAKFVHFLLGTATVALAIPIYRGFSQMKGKIVPILIALISGSIASIGSAVLIAKYMNANESIVGSMYTKSVTAPIAMGIAERIQVSPTLTAVFTVITGILGAILAPYILDAFKIRPWWVRGTAIGLGAHGLGITRAFSVNEQAGIFASMAMGLNGVLSAIVLPFVYTMLHR